MKKAALAVVALLALLALVRAFGLELDPYDAYEVRASARAIAGDPLGRFAIYRSPVLTLAEVPFEKWARGSRVAWVFPHVLTALAYAALALGTRRLARAAGAGEAAAACAAIAVALDRLAWADAPLGLPDGLAAGLATWGLALAFEEKFVAGALLLGLAAATRPNDGLACVGVLVALRDRRSVLACSGAVVLFAAITAIFFALGGHSPLGGFGELAHFQHDQLTENYAKYGSTHPRLLVLLTSAFFMEPGTALLAPVVLALLRGRKELGLALVVLVHVVFLTGLVGHVEARYVLPALPPLAALAACVLERRLTGRLRTAVLGAWVLLPLLALPYEVERARDPVFSRNLSAEAASAVASLTSSGTIYIAPDLPFPVYPRVLGTRRTPFPGDPFHGIHHMGALTIGYHLDRRVIIFCPRDASGAAIAGDSWLPQLEKDSMFTSEDVLLLGTSLYTSWSIPERAPSLFIYRVKPRIALVKPLSPP